MKHNLKITVILLSMFLVTQLIGLVVVNAQPTKIDAIVNGQVETVTNPYLFWIDNPEPQSQGEAFGILGSVIIAFIFAIILLFIFMKFKIQKVLRVWFFVVVSLALFLAFVALFKIAPFTVTLEFALIFSAALALILAYVKHFKRNFLVHNLTELLIYPGIAAVFVPILNIWTIIILLVLISLYDAWAVWHSGIMIKMAKFQMNELKVFGGLMIPYASKKVRAQIKKLRKTKSKVKKKIRISLAILGGGDLVFPLIAAGVVLTKWGLPQALLVTLGATLGLSYLFFVAKKKKFYPAMPFITTGVLIGMGLGYLIF